MVAIWILFTICHGAPCACVLARDIGERFSGCCRGFLQHLLAECRHAPHTSMTPSKSLVGLQKIANSLIGLREPTKTKKPFSVLCSRTHPSRDDLVQPNNA